MGFDYVRDATGVVTVTMDMDGQSANTMTAAYHALMGDTLARLEREDGLTGVIFASAKSTFFAGGDLNGLYAARSGDAAYQAWLTEDKGYLRRLERLPVPVVAAINGAALGGGLEICLACNHRILVDTPRAVVGLPEVTLGLLPGAGGTARLPRLIALDPALDLLLSGRTIAPSEALSLGVVDALVPQVQDLLPAARAWIAAHPQAHRQPWDRGASHPGVDVATAQSTLERHRSAVLARTRGKFPAPERILDIVAQGLTEDIDATLDHETRAFASLIGQPVTRACIWSTFFAANALRTGKTAPQAPLHPVAHLAVQGEALAALAQRAARRLQVSEGAEAPVDLLLTTQPQATRGAASLVGVGQGGTLAAPDAGCFGFHLPRPDAPRLIEILRLLQSSEATLASAHACFRQIGLVPVVVQDGQSVVQRLRAALDEECAALRAEGHGAEAVAQALFVAGYAEATEVVGAPAPAPEVCARLLFAPAIAALRALHEGRITHPEEIDIAALQGIGFPAHLGGPVEMLRGMGRAEFSRQADHLARAQGPRFAVLPAWLAADDTAQEEPA